MKNYWGYRIDTKNIAYFQKELLSGVLRQGWGYDEGQNLRYNPLKIDNGANRNRKMLQVKKGDYLLIPRLPEWGKVTIAEATEDWEIGYDFQIDKNIKDFGHMFPAKILKVFVRSNENISSNIKTTLKNISRFWSVNHCSEEIEKLLISDESLVDEHKYEDKFNGTLNKVFKDNFNERQFKEDIYEQLNYYFCNEEWEFALVEGLKIIYPFYTIERVGGKEEINHGTDILIKMPSILKEYEYGVAIQVKDYIGEVSTNVITQIHKAEKYFEDKNELKLIDKIIIITRAKQEDNLELMEKAKEKNIKVIFSNDLKEILFSIAKKATGIEE